MYPLLNATPITHRKRISISQSTHSGDQSLPQPLTEPTVPYNLPDSNPVDDKACNLNELDKYHQKLQFFYLEKNFPPFNINNNHKINDNKLSATAGRFSIFENGVTKQLVTSAQIKNIQGIVFKSYPYQPVPEKYWHTISWSQYGDQYDYFVAIDGKEQPVLTKRQLESLKTRKPTELFEKQLKMEMEYRLFKDRLLLEKNKASAQKTPVVQTQISVDVDEASHMEAAWLLLSLRKINPNSNSSNETGQQTNNRSSTTPSYTMIKKKRKRGLKEQDAIHAGPEKRARFSQT